MGPLNGNFHKEVEYLLKAEQPSIIIENKLEREKNPFTDGVETIRRPWQIETIFAAARLNGHSKSEFVHFRITRQKGAPVGSAEYQFILGDCDGQGNPMPQGKKIAIQTADGNVIGNIIFANKRFRKLLDLMGDERKEIEETRALMKEMRTDIKWWEPRFGLSGAHHWETEAAIAGIFPETINAEGKKGGIRGSLMGAKILTQGRIRIFWGKFLQTQKQCIAGIEGSQEFGPHNLVEPITLEKWEQLKFGLEDNIAGKYRP